jgi:uncharacterized membrane protein HdeD (DUF308 family)
MEVEMSEIQVYLCNRDKWWVVLIQGILFFLFGIVLLIWPGQTAVLFMQITGVFLIVSNIVQLFHWNELRPGKSPAFVGGMSIVTSLLGIILGVFILLLPVHSMFIVFIMIGIWLFMGGVMNIFFVAKRNSIYPDQKGSIFYGIMMIVLAVLFVLFPLMGAMSAIILIGIYSILIGFYIMFSAFNIKKDCSKLA